MQWTLQTLATIMGKNMLGLDVSLACLISKLIVCAVSAYLLKRNSIHSLNLLLSSVPATIVTDSRACSDRRSHEKFTFLSYWRSWSAVEKYGQHTWTGVDGSTTAGCFSAPIADPRRVFPGHRRAGSPWSRHMQQRRQGQKFHRAPWFGDWSVQARYDRLRTVRASFPGEGRAGV